METLLEEIRDCVRKDKATLSDYLGYIGEEFGEVCTCVSVKKKLKNKDLREKLEQEGCDVIISTLAIMMKNNPDWTWKDIKAYMNKKIKRWGGRLK